MIKQQDVSLLFHVQFYFRFYRNKFRKNKQTKRYNKPRELRKERHLDTTTVCALVLNYIYLYEWIQDKKRRRKKI